MVFLNIGEKNEKIGVVRDAFLPARDSSEPLSNYVASIGPNSVAISSQISQNPHRLIVDEYQLCPDGSYRISNVATPLLR